MDIHPYWQSHDGAAVLYHGDCLAILPELAAGSVDAVITDPPYGIGFKYSTHDDTPDGYGKWLWSIIEMCENTAKPDSPVFVWQAMLNVRHFSEWFPRDWRLFAACKSFVQFRPISVQYSWDPVVYWGKVHGEPSVYRKDWHLQMLAPFGAGRKRIEHPCPRPLEQVAYIVDLAARLGDVVLDPFMGSGTTGVACLQTGRKFIGIEQDAGYCAVAAKRLEEASMQPLLMEV